MTENGLQTRPLTQARAAQAYPLVRELSGAGTLADWLRFAGRHPGPGMRGGIMVCEHGGYIRGLFGWEIGRSVACRRELQVRHFIAPGVVDSPAVVGALLDAVEALARQHGCAEIAVDMPISGRLNPAFAAHGLVADSLRLHRRTADGRRQALRPPG